MKKNELFHQIHEEIKNKPEYMTAKIVIDINESILERMDTLSISQSELAEKIGVKQSFLSRLFNHSTNMTIKTLVTIAYALDLELQPLVFKPKETVFKPILSRPININWSQQAFFPSIKNQELFNNPPENESDKSDNLSTAA